MSFRVRGDGASITRTSSLPTTSAAYTACGWFIQRANTATWAHLMSLKQAASGGQPRFDFTYNGNASGVGLVVKTLGSISGTVLVPTINQWFFAAITADGSICRAYATHGNKPFSKSTVTPDSNFTPGVFTVGDRYASGSEPLNGSARNVRVWGAVLTEAELWREMYATAPMHKGGLKFWWPLLDGADKRDLSGNNAHGTITGTPVADIEPYLLRFNDRIRPIKPIYFLPPPSAGSQTITASAIASDEAFGSHTVASVSGQSITPTGIAGAEAFGSHTLANVSAQSITASGIASDEAVGSHTIAGTANRTLATDPFTRADQSGLGGNWSNVGGDAAWNIVSNRAQSSSNYTAWNWEDGVTTWPNDQWAEATFVSGGVDYVYGQALGVRRQSGSVNGYSVWYGTDAIGVVKDDSDGSLLASTTPGLSNGDVIYIEVIGNQIRVKVNGTIIPALTCTDGTYTSGRPGISGGVGGATFIMDDWSAGDFTASDDTISPSGIASDEAFGTAVIADVALDVSPSGISSAEAFGSHTLANATPQSISANGISTAESFGSHTLANVAAQAITASAIDTAEAFGTTVIADVTLSIVTTGIASDEAFGDHTVATDSTKTITVTGIASAEAIGDAVLANVAAQSIVASAIAGAEAFGTATLTQTGQSISITGIASAEAFGSATVEVVVQVITPSGIASLTAFGSATVGDVGGGAVATGALFVPLWRIV